MFYTSLIIIVFNIIISSFHAVTYVILTLNSVAINNEAFYCNVIFYNFFVYIIIRTTRGRKYATEKMVDIVAVVDFTAVFQLLCVEKSRMAECQ